MTREDDDKVIYISNPFVEADCELVEIPELSPCEAGSMDSGPFVDEEPVPEQDSSPPDTPSPPLRAQGNLRPATKPRRNARRSTQAPPSARAGVESVVLPAEPTRKCPTCGATLPLQSVTCRSCYRRDFAPVLRGPGRSLLHRMAILGLAGCGKTVFLTQLFWFLEEDAFDNPDFPWRVRLETAAARRFIAEGRERIVHGQWPLKTSAFEEQAIHVSVHSQKTDRRIQLLINDVSGESIQRFFSSADRPQDDPERAAYLGHLFNAQSFLLLLDAQRLTRRDAWDVDGFASMFAREHGISAEPKDLWLALVITKADELGDFEGSPEELARDCLRGTFTRLEECFKYVRVFLVSAAGQVVAASADPEAPASPDPYALPVGIVEPLAWILDGVERYHEKRLERRRQEKEEAEGGDLSDNAPEEGGGGCFALFVFLLLCSLAAGAFAYFRGLLP